MWKQSIVSGGNLRSSEQLRNIDKVRGGFYAGSWCDGEKAVIKDVIRAAILNPERTGRVRFYRDGALTADANGQIESVGEWAEFEKLSSGKPATTRLTGLVCPPFLDAHIHIPQFPIRGRFAEGVEELADGGRLLAGLQRNVFPAEAKCSDAEYTTRCVRQFAEDTFSQGVVGGAAYMTVHAGAAQIALRELGALWSAGMVLMNQNCPEYLRTDEANMDRDMRRLAEEFGPRVIATDRFAVAVNSDLRRQAVRLAGELGLRTQTHLNEQRAEKRLVEEALYPGQTYTGVYQADGLLSHRAILAHCIWMSDEEWSMVSDSGSVIAHCPTSNSLLGSGVMQLDEVRRREIPYAICTDVGASPTTSILCEMAEFLRVHDGLHGSATAEEALFRSTLAPAQILGMDQFVGSFEKGKPLSFIEIDPAGPIGDCDSERIIREHLLEIPRSDWPPHGDLRKKLAACGLQAPVEMDALAEDVQRTIATLKGKVRQVVMEGKQRWRRAEAS